MKKEFYIGNITKVRWHYRNMKYNMTWGHTSESFDINSYVSKQHPHLETAVITEMDTTMNPDKFYAYVCIDKDNKLTIRNLFDSKHEKGFSQKNTYFRDEIYYDLFLDDTSNLLDAYLQLGNITRDYKGVLYFCVEYEPNHKIDLDLILYCSELEHIKTILEDKINKIEIQNALNENKSKKSWFSFWDKSV